MYVVSDDIAFNSVDLYYSTDNGVTWNTIDTNVSIRNEGHEYYEWNIPQDAPLNELFKSKIVVKDTTGNSIEKIVGPYSIIDSVLPEIRITSPKARDILDIGRTFDITWDILSSTQLAFIRIWFVNDAGDYTALPLVSNLEGPYTWSIPSNIGIHSNAKLRFDITDINLNEVEIFSDSFSIQDSSQPPPIPWHSPQTITSLSGSNYDLDITTDSQGSQHLVYHSANVIYYKKKNYNSSTWSSAKQIASYDNIIYSIKVVVDTLNNPHVIWEIECYSGNTGEIYYSKLSGSLWSSPQSVSNNNTDSFMPDIMIDTHDNIHVVWVDGRSKNSTCSTTGGSDAIYYSKRSTTGSWSYPTTIYQQEAGYPSIGLAKNDTVVVGFQRGNSFQVITWQENGSWSTPFLLSTGSGAYSEFAFDGDKTHLVFSYYGGVEYSVFDGSSWSDPEKIVSIPNRYALSTVSINSNSAPQIVWLDQNNTNKIHYLQKITNTWSNPIQINMNSSQPLSMTPSSSVSSSDILSAVWVADNGGYANIYYNYADVSTDVAAPEITLLTPSTNSSLSVGSNYSVNWTAEDSIGVSNIILKYTIDEGNNFNTIAGSVPNTGSYNWSVPNIEADSVQIYITALDEAGNKTTVNSGKFRITDQTGPSITISTPSGGETWSNGDTQSIVWTATDSNSVSSITILYSLDGGSTWFTENQQDTNDGSYSWKVPNIASNQFKIKLVALDSKGNSSYAISETFSIEVSNNVPDVPHSPFPPNTSIVSKNSNTLQWQGGDIDNDSLYYNVYWGTNSNPPLVSGSQSQTSYVATLSSDTTYYWKVIVSDGNTTTSSPVWSFSTLELTQVESPTNFKATHSSSSQINLTWTDTSNNEEGFKIERKSGTTGTYSEIATLSANTNTYSDSGLKGNTEYFYRMRAYKESAHSIYSAESVAVTDNSIPSTPSSPTISGTFSAIIASWSTNDADGDVLTYDVYWGTNANPPLVSSEQSTNIYAPLNLIYNQVYFWKVVVKDSYHAVAESPLWKYTAPNESKPDDPTNLSIDDVSSLGVFFHWTDNSNNESGFKIERKTGTSGSYQLINLTNSASYVDKNFKTNTTYVYRVRAYNASGNSDYTNEIIVKTPPLPPNVTGDAVTKDTTPSWRWTPGGGGNGQYRVKLDNGDLSSGAIVIPITTYTPSMTINDGYHTLYVQESNSNGYWSESARFTLIVDSQTPQTKISPNEGTFTSAQYITLSCEDTGTDCVGTYFTLDGSLPTTNSSLYTERIAIFSDTNLKYFSVDNAGNYETVQSALIKIDCLSQQSGMLLGSGLLIFGNTSCGQADDRVIIANGYTLNWDGSNAPFSGTITIKTGGKLIIIGNTQISGTLALEGGTLEIGGEVVIQGTLDTRGSTLLLSGSLNISTGTFQANNSTKLILTGDSVLTFDQAVSIGQLSLNDHALVLSSSNSDITVTQNVTLDHVNERIITGAADFILLGALTMSNGLITSTGGTIALNAGGNISGGVLITTGGTVELSSTEATTFSGNSTLALYNSTLQSADSGTVASIIFSDSPNVSMYGGSISDIQVSGGTISTHDTSSIGTVVNVSTHTSGFTIGSISGNVQESGTWATFSVNLTSRPQGDVVLGIASSDNTEGTVSPSQLTFTSDNWNAPQTVTVTGVDDNVDDGDQTFNAVISLISSADSAFVADDLRNVTLNNIDDETAGVTVSSISGNITEEGSTATFTVKLNSQPTANVNLALNSSDYTEGTISSSMLTFTSDNWNGLWTVTVTGVNDDVADGDQTLNIAFSVASNDPKYNSLQVLPVTVTNIDDDQAGFLIGEIQGSPTEEGGSATFTMRLSSKPVSDVTVGISSSDSDEVTVSLSSWTFTPDNWNSAKTITLTGHDDFLVDGNQPVSIILSQATSGDPNYNNLNPTDVTVFNADNDTAGFLVSNVGGPVSENGSGSTFTVRLSSKPTANVSFDLSSSDTGEGTVSHSSLTFTPDNWNSIQTVTITGVDDVIIDGSQAFYIHLFPAISSDSNYNGLDPSNVNVVNVDNETPGFVISATSKNTTEQQTTATFTVKLTSQPSAKVVIGVSSSDNSEGTVSISTLTLTPDNWNAQNTVMITGVNDEVQDGNQSFKILLSKAVSADSNYHDMKPDDVNVINEDDDVAGITVSSISGKTTEQGGTATFTVKLNTQPVSDVSITLSTSDNTEGVVSPKTLTLTENNWNGVHTITITGVNDEVLDGDQAFKVILGEIISDDPHYNALNPDDVTVINEDDDIGGFMVSEISGQTDEAKTSATFTVRLKKQPGSNVTIHLSSSDTTEGTISQDSLVFTAENWQSFQKVMVTGVNDDVQDGNQAYKIILSKAESSDLNYQDLDPADVEVINIDDDIAGIVLGTISGETSESGDSATFTVKLRSQPTHPVTLNLSSSDIGEGDTELKTLVFTPVNWNSTQTVKVLGINDSLADASQNYRIQLTASSLDDHYQNLTPPTVEVINRDDDSAGFIISEMSGSTTEEGGTASFTVRLSSEPFFSVTLPLKTSNLHEGTLSSTELMFTPDNWNTDQTVVVTGVDDMIKDGDQRYNINLGKSISKDNSYNNQIPPAIEVTNIDNDEAGIVVSSISGNTDENGTTATFTIELKTQPLSNVKIGFSSSNPKEGIIEPAELIILKEDWKTAHPVTVTGVSDEMKDGDQPYLIQLTRSNSLDPNYHDLPLEDVKVTNVDVTEARFIVSEITGKPSENKDQATFTIKLSSKPAADVLLKIKSTDMTEGMVLPNTVLFNDQNWNAEHAIRIIGLNDSIKDGDQTFNILFDPAKSLDPNYEGQIPEKNFTTENLDNDPEVVISDSDPSGTDSGNDPGTIPEPPEPQKLTGEGGSKAEVPKGATVWIDEVSGVQTISSIPTFGSGNVEAITTTIEKDGSMTNSIQVGNLTTEVHLPVGTETQVTETGVSTSKTPEVSISSGKTLTTSTVTNADGEIEVEVTVKGIDGNSESIVLPKIQPGSSVEIDNVAKKIVVVSALNLPSSNSSEKGARASINPSSYFVGRDIASKKAVTIVPANGDPQTGSIQLTMTKDFEGTETKISVEGEAQILIGKEPHTSKEIVVENKAQTLAIPQGGKLVSLPANLSLKVSELETKFAAVDAVWVYRTVPKTWAFYSSNRELSNALLKLEVNKIASPLLPGDGIWILTNNAVTLRFSDNGDYDILDEKIIPSLSSGWHFIGNSNATTAEGIGFKNITDQNANIRSLWKYTGKQWHVFTTDIQLKKAYEEKNLVLLPENTMIQPGEAVWIEVTDEKNAKNLRHSDIPPTMRTGPNVDYYWTLNI
ncbi:Calx-beta domain-containing protein [Deltaproteobacteria bacterium TL4]